MKRAILLLGFLAVLLSCTTPPEAMPLPPEEQIVRRVITVDRPGDELYRLSMEWMAKTFRSAQDVIQYQDKEEGIIVGKGVVMIAWAFSPRPTHFTLTIEVRDGRARITFSDIYYVITVGSARETGPIESQNQLERFAQEAAYPMIGDLARALEEGTDDW